MNQKFKLKLIGKFALKSHFTNCEWNVLKYLSKDANYEIRLRVAELLGQYQDPISEEILSNMLFDKEELVRAEACCSLAFSKNLNIQGMLIDLCLKDHSSLVIGYAILTIADIQNNSGLRENKSIIRNFQKFLNKEEWLEIAVLRSLVVIGEDKYEKILIDKIESSDYLNRRFAVSLCEELVDIKKITNIGYLKDKLLKQSKIERVESVLKALCELIKKCEQSEDGLA